MRLFFIMKEKRHFSLRKLAIGVCSVCLGVSLASHSVKAEEATVTETPTTELLSGQTPSAALASEIKSSSMGQSADKQIESSEDSNLALLTETKEETETTKLVNVVKGKTPTSNSTTMITYELSTIPSVQIENPKQATDGSKNSGSTDKSNTKILAGQETGGKDNGYSSWQPVYLQYDFGDVKPVERIAIYRNTYSDAISTFKKVKVELSTEADFSKNSQVIFEEADFVETVGTKGQPQIIELLKTVNARYIRIWGQGHYIQNTNSSWAGYSSALRFNEVEVLARVKDDGSQNNNTTLVNLAALKQPYVYGLDPTNLEAINDGKFDENYAYHNTRGASYLQYEFKRSYNIKEIRFKLKPGLYSDIAVSFDNTPSPNDGYESIYKEENKTIDSGDIITVSVPEDAQSQYVRFSACRADREPVGYSEIEILGTGDSYDESRPDYVEPNSKFNKLVWSDEFNGDTIDESKWQIIDGMVNHAAIYNRGAVSIKKDADKSYLSIRSQNYASTDELIKAVGIDRYDDKKLASKITWSSGRVESKDKYSFQYGRMAVRAKVNDSQGIWPAIWMLAQDETGHDEIDVLEFLGQTPWEAWTTNHYGILAKNKASHGVPIEYYEAWSQAFHVYEVEWTPESIKWFIDGEYVFGSDRGRDDGRDGMHSRPMFPILETQVGDGWVGNVDYDKNKTKQNSEYLIDWIRVYQEDNQDQVYFDNLDKEAPSGDYYIQPTHYVGQLTAVSDGKEDFENKNHFYYGGQPRYETSRLFASDDNQENALIYKIDHPSAVHLTTYYKTLSDYKVYNAAAWANEGQSIRAHLLGDDTIDFKVYLSADGNKWTETGLSVVDNFVEATPAYARTNFDARDLAEGTHFVKIVFPKVSGRQYRLANQSLQEVIASDVQLAKVTFTAPKQVKPNQVEQVLIDDKVVNSNLRLTEALPNAQPLSTSAPEKVTKSKGFLQEKEILVMEEKTGKNAARTLPKTGDSSTAWLSLAGLVALLSTVSFFKKKE